MNLRAKIYVESQKKRAQANLDARRAFLRVKGFNNDAIKKDAITRKLKADVREADFRLASIVAQEKLNQDRAQAKADKLAGKAPEKEAREEEPEKKEKKGKKEKTEKQAKSEGKKEKPEKKAEQLEAQ